MRLIDADELIEIAHEMIQEDPDAFNGGYSYDAVTVEEINEAPTVEAVPVVHGCVKTVVGKMGVMHQECSACGNVLEWKAYPNYCDECGAKLDGADMRTSAE